MGSYTYIHCWTEHLYLRVLIPPPHPTDCVSTALFFLPECLQSKALKEEVNMVHLFLNPAKSSQAGNRMEGRKVLGVTEPYFSCSSSVNAQHLRLPPFRNATPFRTYVILPTSSPSLAAAVLHRGALPARVLRSLSNDLTSQTSATTWEMGLPLKSRGQLEGYLYLESFV